MPTFLFTDIEGSTRLWSRAPVAMATAIQRQETLLRAIIAHHQGMVFKTVGDGVYAVFPHPDDAVRAAVDAQRALLAEPWTGFDPDDGLPVRIALHTGPAEPRAGDWYGPPLNRLSRTLDAGHGGQILVTGDTLAACGEHWPAGIDARDLGERALRDVPGSGRLFQLLAPGLPEHFPPLSTLDLRVHNLPHWPTDLIDRDDEQDRLRRQLRARDARLVTVLGMGGVGKTRLTTEVASQLLDEFQDGIRFVDLSALREDEQVLPAIVQVTGAVDQLLTPHDALLDWLRHRNLLLLLDNCEQVSAGVASIASDILTAAPGVVLLATSRTPLRIRGEQHFALDPLPLPVDAEEAEGNPGVRLFAARAQDVSERFLLDAESTPAVAEICRIVDGIPLAIELAAPWVRILSPAALHRRLQESRSILRDGARDLPDRQRTLAATIAWSYALLDPGDQRAFRRLAVFRGGIAVDAAAAVIWDEPVADPLWALTRLDALMQANLLQAATDPTGEPRFVMLQTIQEFAIDILWQSGERDSAASAHADFFARLAAEAQTHYRTEDSPRWLDLLDRNFENLRAAIEFDAATPERNEAGLQLVVSLADFLYQRCHVLQAREWFRLAYRDAATYPTELRVEALFYQGNAWFSNPAIAGQYYRKAIEAAEDTGEATLRNRSVASLSLVASLNGDYVTASAMARDVLAYGQSKPDARFEALGRERLAHVASEAGWFDLALHTCQDARSNYLSLGDSYGEGWVWLIEGRTYRRLLQSESALTALEHALDRLLGARDDEVIGVCHLERGLALLEIDLAFARIAFETAITKLANVNDAYSMIELLEGTARLLVYEHAPESAVELIGAARRLREQTGIVSSVADVAAVQASIDAAYAMLGKTAFDVAVERGMLLSPRAALESFKAVPAGLQAG